jgi:hypothetical protein
MVQICRKCRKPNPDHARFCHFDGENLTGTAPTRPPPPSAQPWLKSAGVLALACLVVLAIGFLHKPLAIFLVVASLGFAGWKMHHGRVWRQPNWWRIEGPPYPSILTWTVGSLVGIGVSFGVAGTSRLPVTPDSPELAPRQTTVAQVRLAKPEPPPDAPVKFCMIRSPLLVSSNNALSGDRSLVAESVVDGDIESCWSAAAEAKEAWLEVGFEEPYEIDGIVIWNGGGSPIHSARLEFSDGSTQFIELKDLGAWQLAPLRPTKTDKVRFVALTFHDQGNLPVGGSLAEVWYCYRGGLEPSQGDWKGAWRTGELGGDLQMEQIDAWVLGSYADGLGSLIGKSTARQVHANWYFAGDSGEVVLQLSAGANSFTGKWRSGPNGDWTNDSVWSGARR